MTSDAPPPPSAEPREPIVVKLVEHLDRAQLTARLAEAGKAVEAQNQGGRLLVDCMEMTGYDLAARTEFVAWNAKYKARITHVAIATSKPLWRMVVGAMALASGANLKAYPTREEAMAALQQAP